MKNQGRCKADRTKTIEIPVMSTEEIARQWMAELAQKKVGS